MNNEDCKSCVGCKFLYTYGIGYSNYTWEENRVCCALNNNSNLPADECWDWKSDKPENDNWDKTNSSRCIRYAPGKMVKLDVEGEDCAADCTSDPEAIEAIDKDSGRNSKR